MTFDNFFAAQSSFLWAAFGIALVMGAVVGLLVSSLILPIFKLSRAVQ